MRLGPLCKMYINSGTYEAQVWLEVNLISDLNVNPSWDKDESSTRTSRVKTQEQTMMGIEVTGKIRKEILSTTFLLLRSAFNNATPLDVLVLDGSLFVAGSDGFRFGARVYQFGEDQSLGKVVFKDFSLEPCVLLDSNGAEQPARAALTTAPSVVDFSTMG